MIFGQRSRPASVQRQARRSSFRFGHKLTLRTVHFWRDEVAWVSDRMTSKWLLPSRFTGALRIVQP